ncbi:MAG: hypothetical protein QF410_15845, partial [Planctomycetota bacterium]|nr:hypothetical protein [Planctomycetota bacterium]
GIGALVAGADGGDGIAAWPGAAGAEVGSVASARTVALSAAAARTPLAFADGHQVPKEMDRADMNDVRDAFVRATEMAEDCGFDLVELHMAHGYLLSNFISPLTNRRRDVYGGEIEARMRYPLEVF